MEPAITHESGEATLHRITATSLKALCRAAQVSPKGFTYQGRKFRLAHNQKGYVLLREDPSLYGTFWGTVASGSSMDKLSKMVRKIEESGWLLKAPSAIPQDGDDLIKYEPYNIHDPKKSPPLRGELVILSPKFMNAPLQERIFNVLQETEKEEPYVEGFHPADPMPENGLVFRYWIEAVITNKAEVLEMLQAK